MQIIYQVYLRDYKQRKTEFIGTIVDYWQEVDFIRAREKAIQTFGKMVPDPRAIFVLKEVGK